MSGKQLTAKDLNKISTNYFSKKVDINDLLSKVRKQQKKERKDNYIFISLICGAVAVSGVIASL